MDGLEVAKVALSEFAALHPQYGTDLSKTI